MYVENIINITKTAVNVGGDRLHILSRPQLSQAS